MAAAGRMLVLGATGMLGQAVIAEAAARNIDAIGAARGENAERRLDLTDPGATATLVRELEPAVVINCAALVDLAECEKDPGGAYLLNARPPAVLAELSRELGFRLVQVSTDHFWTGDGRALHDENAPVRVVNEYARTKLAGELFALTAPEPLVLRTNLVGFRGWERPTFAEWALGAIRGGEQVALFDDFITSSIDTGAFCQGMLDLLDAGSAGLINLASSEPASKREFVFALAAALGEEPPEAQSASVRELAPRRAESLGLDVSLAERLLQRDLPSLEQTVASLAGTVRASA